MNPFTYQAHGFVASLGINSLTFTRSETPSDDLYHEGRWAVFLALLALEANRGSNSMLRPDILRDYQPWHETQAPNVGQRIRKEILKWQNAGLRLIDYRQITGAWRLREAVSVSWLTITPEEVEAEISTPGLAEWGTPVEDPTFSVWLNAMIRATVYHASDRVDDTIRQLNIALEYAPSGGPRAAALVELTLLAHGRPAFWSDGLQREARARQSEQGPIGRAVALHWNGLQLLDTRTESLARQFITLIEGDLRRGSGDIGASQRALLLAMAAVAWRRAGAYERARAAAGAAAVAAFLARDLRLIYQAIAELMLAGYQDKSFRERSTAWIQWAIACIRLETHVPIVRDSRVAPLVVVRALTFARRLYWARLLLERVSRQLREHPRRRDEALAAACGATLLYANASVDFANDRLALVRASDDIRKAYTRAKGLHDELQIPAAWFMSELDALNNGQPIAFHRRDSASARSHKGRMDLSPRD